MEFRLLGPLEVVDGDGQPVEIRGEKQRALLTLLALRPDKVVSTSQVVESLWGEQDIRDPGNAVQVLVSKLRRALGDDDRTIVVTSAAGYTLAVDPDDVDWVRFEQLASAGRRLLDEGDAGGAAGSLREALALWRARPFADIDDEDFAAGERSRLEELRAITFETRVDADLQLGLHEQLVAELEAAIAAQPLRERLRAQQMLALYRSGRQVDALRAFQAARELLAEEIGVDPGPELQRLEAEILAQSPTLDHQPTTAASRGSGNLPAAVSQFIGRADELTELDDLVQNERLVTIVGPGGAGKTRLALETASRVASRHPDGCWLVELAAVMDPALVETTAANALGLDQISRLDDYGANREALIVIDNCEHVIVAAAALVSRLLRSGPGVRVIATSREGLGVPGEQRWLVPPLDAADARLLFVDRARLGGSITPPDQLDLVNDICSQLDGLPLAVELAAARTRTLSLGDIATRIDDRFRLLTTGERTAQPRQQTLRGVVDWSYDLLFAEEQRVFRRLSVFVGGFDLRAVERVAADATVPEDEVVDILGRLVEKSLVFVTSRQGAGRYQLLQTLIDYGRERLIAAGEEADTKKRHLDWCVDVAADAHAGLQGAEQAGWVDIVLAERHNLRAAAQWGMSVGHTAEATAIAVDVAFTWLVSGLVSEGRQLLEVVLGAGDEVPNGTRAGACAWAAYLTQFMEGTTTEVIDLAERGVALGRDASAEAFSLGAVMAALVFGFSGRTGDAVAVAEEAAVRLAREPDAWMQGWVNWTLAGLMQKLGRPDDAASFLLASVDGFAAIGDPTGTAMATLRVSELAEARGAYDDAFDAAKRSYEAAVASGGRRFTTSTSATRLGNLAALQDRYGEAADWHALALTKAKEGAFPGAVAQALSGMGLAAYRQGLLDEAEQRHREALGIYETSASAEGVAFELASLGFIALDRGSLQTASDLLSRSLEEAGRGSDRHAIALALEGLAGIRVRGNEGRSAALLLGAAAALRDEIGDAVPATRSERIAHDEEEVRTLIGEELATAEHARGHLAPDVVVADLLAEVAAG